ncbi:MAG: type II toxin-antitoxin system Phd/YefM family antitoxin [Desulfobacterales bacterium]|uniref:Antitoxin n=1 Tax=Candidatus Desulfatibia vada TaxID=2841696 RepID=A0A8J6TJ70_9BACT|nr:type II toxin-antitoxin system Phd/YefM family antitoxin [Candidatus Desulfatibia vada]
MKLSEDVKPISYFKAHASEIIRQIFGKNKTMVITQNGEAKVVVQDIYLYEQTQESLAMLKILAMSSQSLREGRRRPVKDSFDVIRARVKEDRGT